MSNMDMDGKIIRLILMIVLIIGGFKFIHMEVSELYPPLQIAILGSYLILAIILCVKNR